MRPSTSLTGDTQDALAELEDFADDVGLPFVLRSTRRSCEEQANIFDQGRRAPGPIVTTAEGCESWHVLGRAVDISLPKGSTRSDYQKLGEFWEELGGNWGGRFTTIDDPGHFEWHPGMKIEEVCPVPQQCEAAVAAHLRDFGGGGSSIPWGGMFAVAGVAAAGMIWWKG